MAVYLPPREATVATPEAIARASAIAEGKLVDLPTAPTARAIIAADRKAREPDGGNLLEGEAAVRGPEFTVVAACSTE